MRASGDTCPGRARSTCPGRAGRRPRTSVRARSRTTRARAGCAPAERGGRRGCDSSPDPGSSTQQGVLPPVVELPPPVVELPPPVAELPPPVVELPPPVVELP